MNSHLIRVLSIALIGAFLAQEIAFAAPGAASFMSPAVGYQTIQRDPSQFEAPVDFSTLKEVYKGPGQKLIIHIQDAHSNLSGQENLASTLDEIMKKYGISLVLSEGGQGDCSLTSIKKAASADVWKKVAKKFLVQGKMQGEEYLNLISDLPMKIVGIEEMSLYVESVEKYSALAELREETLDYLSRIQVAMEKIKTKTYPRELLDYEKGASQPIDQRVKMLLALSSPENLKAVPNILKLKAILEQEQRINFEAANLEQAALIEQIADSGGKADLDDHFEKMKHMKDSKLSQFAYFQKTLNIARQNSIDLSLYENLNAYGVYLKGFSELDLESLFMEMETLEDDVYRAILTKSAEADGLLVRSIDRYLSLLNSAYRIRMTTHEFDLFRANEADFLTESYQALINRRLMELGYFEDIVPFKDILGRSQRSLEEFYRSVSARDLAFMRNIEKEMSAEGAAVVIAGGYHTQGLSRLFKANGYSYAVLAPHVNAETNQAKYEKLLLAPVKNLDAKSQASSQTKNSAQSLAMLKSSLLERSEGVRVALLLEARLPGSSLKELLLEAKSHERASTTGTRADASVPSGSRLANGLADALDASYWHAYYKSPRAFIMNAKLRLREEANNPDYADWRTWDKNGHLYREGFEQLIFDSPGFRKKFASVFPEQAARAYFRAPKGFISVWAENNQLNIIIQLPSDGLPAGYPEVLKPANNRFCGVLMSVQLNNSNRGMADSLIQDPVSVFEVFKSSKDPFLQEVHRSIIAPYLDYAKEFIVEGRQAPAETSPPDAKTKALALISTFKNKKFENSGTPMQIAQGLIALLAANSETLLPVFAAAKNDPSNAGETQQMLNWVINRAVPASAKAPKSVIVQDLHKLAEWPKSLSEEIGSTPVKQFEFILRDNSRYVMPNSDPSVSLANLLFPIQQIIEGQFAPASPTDNGPTRLKDFYLNKNISLRFDKANQTLIFDASGARLAEAEIRSQILQRIHENNGRITFKEFQDLALFGDHGYYTSGIVQFGQTGSKTDDGVTFRTDSENPNIGLGLAKQFHDFWKEMGSPERFEIVEQGGGSGLMAKNILDSIRREFPEFYARVAYRILDISPNLSDRQRSLLQNAGHQNAEFSVGAAYQMPFADGQVEGVFFSNELPDAFPVHRVVTRGGTLKEIYVRERNGELYEEEGEISDPALLSYFSNAKSIPPEGKEFAVNLMMGDWMKEVSRVLKRGFVITVDYGFEKTSTRFQSSHPQAVWNLNESPILSLGVDITHNVDFETLAAMGQKAGLAKEHLGDFDRWINFFSRVIGSVNPETFVLVQSKLPPAPQNVSGGTVEPVRFAQKYGARLIQNNLSSAADLKSDHESLVLLAMAYLGRPRDRGKIFSALLRDLGMNAKVSFIKRSEMEDGRMVHRVYAQLYAGQDRLKAFDQILLDESILSEAQSRMNHSSLDSSLGRVFQEPAVTLEDLQGVELAEHLRSLALVKKLADRILSQKGRNAYTERPLLFRFVGVDPVRQKDYEDLLGSLARVIGGTVSAQFGRIENGRYIAESDASKIGDAWPKDGGIIYVGELTPELLQISEARGLLSLPTIKGNQGTLNPLLFQGLVFSSFVQRLDKPVEVLQQIWRIVRADVTVELTPENFRLLKTVDAAADINRYLGLTMKLVALEWKKILNSTQEALRAIGSAA